MTDSWRREMSTVVFMVAYSGLLLSQVTTPTAQLPDTPAWLRFAGSPQVYAIVYLHLFAPVHDRAMSWQCASLAQSFWRRLSCTWT